MLQSVNTKLNMISKKGNYQNLNKAITQMRRTHFLIFFGDKWNQSCSVSKETVTRGMLWFEKV